MNWFRVSVAARLLSLLLFLIGSAGASGQTLGTPELTYARVSGAGAPFWVQGAPSPSLGVTNAGLPLQPALVVPTQASWSGLADARWIGATPNGVARPGGYEYFTLFALPPGYVSARLDLLWRADDASEVAFNDVRLPGRGGHFSPSRPVGESHGEVGHLLVPGLNRLQFFVANAGGSNNPTGLLFTARLTLSRSLPEPTLRVTVAGLSSGAFHPDRAKVWHFYRDNPILRPEGEGEGIAGEGSVAAPDLTRVGSLWRMSYVGLGRDGRARIFGAESTDGLFWQRLYEGRPLLDGERAGPGARDVGDPNLVAVADRSELFYTRGLDGGRSLIDRLGEGGVDASILTLGPPGAWDSFRVGRPRVLVEDGLYKMWYDGTPAEDQDPTRPSPAARRAVGFATSRDGVRWEKHAGNPVLRNAGGGDVKRVGRYYVLVHESFSGTAWALGTSETAFEPRGLLVPASGERYDRHGHVSPSLVVEGDRLVALYFGGAEGTDRDPALARDRNRIGVAFLQKAVVARAPDGARIPADVRALDADRVEVRLPEAYRDSPVTFEIVAEDGVTLLLRSPPMPLRPSLYLRFSGSRLDPL